MHYLKLFSNFHLLHFSSPEPTFKVKKEHWGEGRVIRQRHWNLSFMAFISDYDTDVNGDIVKQVLGYCII